MEVDTFDLAVSIFGAMLAPKPFDVAKEKTSFVKDTYTFNFPGAPSELLDTFRAYYGPTMNAFEAAAAAGRETDLHSELGALFNAQNSSPSPDTTVIPATFLRVTVAL